MRNSNSIIRLVAALTILYGGARQARATGPEDISGLVMWLTADELQTNATGQVLCWTDQSGCTNHMVADTNIAPRYVDGVVNGLPVVRFDGTNKYLHLFQGISDIRSIFWVIKEDADASDTFRTLLGHSVSWNFLRGSSKAYWNAGASASVTAGTTKSNGVVVVGTTDTVPAIMSVVTLITTGPVSADQLTTDRSSANRAWDGDIAEILIYNEALSAGDEELVGNYLGTKYGLTTYARTQPRIDNLEGSNVTAALESATMRGTLSYTGTSTTAVSVYYGNSDGGTNMGDWQSDKDFGNCTNTTFPVTYATNITGLTSNKIYYFRYAATNDSGMDWASPSESVLTGEIWIDKTVDASEIGLATGRFTVYRPATATNGTLTVYYKQTAGTAEANTNYRSLSGSATFLEGATNADIIVRPLSDWSTNGNTTLEITLLPGPYLIGTASNAVMTITNAAWSKPVFNRDWVSNLVLWMRADMGVETNGAGSVTNWQDQSKSINHAVPPGGAEPTYVTNAVMGSPVMRFDADGQYFAITRNDDIRAVFWVLKEDADATGLRPLLGDDTSYDFHRKTGAVRAYWGGSASILNGVTKRDGVQVDAVYETPPTNISLITLTTTGPVEANLISSDRVYADRCWDGDIAEIMIFDRALDTDEEDMVGGYLAQKYGLSTVYPPLAAPQSPDVDNAVNGATDIELTSATFNGSLTYTGSPLPCVSVYYGRWDQGTNLAAWEKHREFGVTTNTVLPAAYATNVADLTTGYMYFYTYAASNSAGTNVATPSISFLAGNVWITNAANASEAGLAPGTFTVHRAATATNIAITAYYQVSGGTATPDRNYHSLTSSVTIAQGATSAPVVVTPWADWSTDASTTLELNLLAGKYVIGTQSNSTMTIANNGNLLYEFNWDSVSNLVLWLKSDEGIQTNGPGGVTNWLDQSAETNNATAAPGNAPPLALNVIHGLPVIRFNADSQYLTFTRISDIRSVFWVLKEDDDATSSWRPLLGDASTYHFSRGASKQYWGGNTRLEVRNGVTRRCGLQIDGETALAPTNFAIVSVTTTGPMEANLISSDRATANRCWDGDMAEILIFDRALSASEENIVGDYLGKKYRFATTYEPIIIPPPASGSMFAIR